MPVPFLRPKPCDADPAEPPLGLAELPRQPSIPAPGQINILMRADDPFVLGPLQADIQARSGARAVCDQDHLLTRTRSQARRRQQVRAQDGVVRDAGSECEGGLVVLGRLDVLPRPAQDDVLVDVELIDGPGPVQTQVIQQWPGRLASISRTAEQPNIFMSRPHEISGIAGPPLRIVLSGLSPYIAHFAKTILFVAAFPLRKPVLAPPSFSPGFSHEFEHNPVSRASIEQLLCQGWLITMSPISTKHRLTTSHDSDFFLAPESTLQRQYEALRAYLVERIGSLEVARRFGYTHGYFRVLCHQFRHDPNFRARFFSSIPQGPAPAPVRDPLRDLVVAMRKRNLSVYDIQRSPSARIWPPTAPGSITDYVSACWRHG
ncbi:MAG: hypothetical protein ACHRXM_40495 [Isosphaerales bacterium]